MSNCLRYLRNRWSISFILPSVSLRVSPTLACPECPVGYFIARSYRNFRAWCPSVKGIGGTHGENNQGRSDARGLGETSKETLTELPTRQPDRFLRKDVIGMLRADIRSAEDRGYTIKDITTLLADLDLGARQDVHRAYMTHSARAYVASPSRRRGSLSGPRPRARQGAGGGNGDVNAGVDRGNATDTSDRDARGASYGDAPDAVGNTLEYAGGSRSGDRGAGGAASRLAPIGRPQRGGDDGGKA